MENFDLLVIGGGPGGYSVGIAAAKKGLKVALFEKQYLGGTCLNVGCIPTKYLVDKANAMEKVRALVKTDIFHDAGTFSFKKIQKGKEEVSKKLVGGIEFLLKKTGVTVVKGEATLKKDKVVECDGKQYSGKNVIIANGSETLYIPIPGKELCIDSTDALNLTKLPKSMVVIGGGVIGLELACAFAVYGTEITIVEMLPQIMPRDQKEAVQMVEANLKKLGIKLYTGSKILRVEKDGNNLKAIYEKEGKEESVSCEKVLMAIGRKSNFSGINAEELGLKLDEKKKFIQVDNNQKTNLDGVYAIGDISGGVQLAHAAYAEGEIALKHILGEKTNKTKPIIPSCIYAIPTFASVGLNTERAKEAGYEPVLGTFDYSANGMALAEGASGRVFVIADKKTTKTLGVTIVGENSSEMIALANLAVTDGLTVDQWESMVVAHPSLCEMIREAALDCFGKSVHKG